MLRLLEGEAHLRPPGDRDSRRRQACADEKTISTHELATASRAAAMERRSLRNSILCAIATVTTTATVTTIAGTAADSVVPVAPVAPVAPSIRGRRRRSPRASSSAVLRSACSSRREEEEALQPTERAVESGQPSRETGTRVAVASTAPSP
ncbi:hypothetical protein C5D36_11060 [Rathayibacter sp. AY1C6]|nr:hypothetical protein C5D36_11060 [Rathayibacter sp. AY1C6]